MKRLMSLFLALAMTFSTIISPSFTINVAAQTTTVEATKVYSTNEVTKVSSGSKRDAPIAVISSLLFAMKGRRI